MKNIVFLFLGAVFLYSCETSENNNNGQNNTNTVTVNTPNQEEVNKAKSVNDWINDIKNNPEWLAQCVEKAKQRNISLDEMIAMDAKFSYEQYNGPYDENKEKNKLKSLADWENEIRSKPDLMKDVKKKADERKITVDEMVKIDAQWFYDECRK